MKILILLLVSVLAISRTQEIPLQEILGDQPQLYPGIQVQLTSESINRLLSKFILPQINKQLNGLTFPDINYHEKKESLQINHLKLEKINVDPKQTNFKAENGQILFNVHLTNLEIRFHYKAKKGWLLRSSGRHAYVKAKWLNFQLHLNVINDKGVVNLVTEKVDSSKSKIKIHLGWGPIKFWENMIVTSQVNKHFNQWVGIIEQNIILATQALNGIIGDQLPLKKYKTIGDLELVSNPIITTNELTLDMNGYFHPEGKSTKILKNKYPFAPYDSDATKIYVSSKSVTSLILSIMKSKKYDEVFHILQDLLLDADLEQVKQYDNLDDLIGYFIDLRSNQITSILFGDENAKFYKIIKFRHYYLILVDF